MGTYAQVFLLLVSFFAVGFSQTVHKMAVRSDIRFRFATTEVECVMSNDKETAQELLFDVTLPKDAFISNFSMTIEGKVYPGNVKEKKKAREEYLEARQHGNTGALVEQSARHSNKFDVSVNIAAGNNVTFNLIYQELLRRRFGAYEHSVFVNPSANVRQYSVEVFIQERTEIRDVRTPAMRKDIINNAVEEEVNSLTQISNPSATSAYVVYRPSPAELKAFGKGWFVVQYDVDADDAGELLVVDGYFVHFFMPPDDLPPLPLDIVFVLDISGSMSGRKIEQQRDAMNIILDDLRENDRFNILLFDGQVQQWQQSLQEANAANVGRAHAYVNKIGPRGSTNLHAALMKGIELLQGSREEERVPMMFFLTDGEATAGVQDSKQIVADVSRKNEGVVNVYSLAFGAGADYQLLRQISTKNRGFARKIYEDGDASMQVSGLYREISTIVLRSLTVSYHSTSNNDNGDDGDIIRVDNSTVTTCFLPTVFGKSDFVVAGRLENAELLLRSPEKAGGLKLDISGLAAKGKVNFVLEENDLTRLVLDSDGPTFWNVHRDLSKIAERTWAFLTIKQLLEEKLAAQEDPALVKELDSRILQLSLKYHFVTPLTSMVVTRPEDKINKTKATKEASFLNDDDVKPAHRGQRMGQRMSQKMYRKMVSSHVSAGAAYVPGLASALGPSGDQHFDAMMMPMPLVPRYPATVTMASRHHWTTKTTTTTATPRPGRGKTGGRKPNRGKQGGKKSRGRGRKSGGGGAANRKGKRSCIRNKKVLLQSVTVRGRQTPVACFELRSARTPHNYTVLAHQAANFSLTLNMKKKKLVSSIHIHGGHVNVTVTVDRDGDLLYTPASAGGVRASSDKQNLQLRHGSYVVTVKVAQKKCKATLITVDVSAGANDADSAVVREYQGFAAKAYTMQADDGKTRRKNRKSKRKTKMAKPAKSCVASNVPPERSFILNAKQLMRHEA